MFAARYFTPRYFAPRFFTSRQSGGAAVSVPVASWRIFEVAVGDQFTISSQVLVASTRQGLDLRDSELQLVIEDARGVDVAVVEAGDIAVDTETPSIYRFGIPPEATTREVHYMYSLRDTKNGIVLQHGPWLVRGRARKD